MTDTGSNASGATPQGPAIRVQGLSKAYGRTRALRGLDLEVPWGRVLTVLGPNGSGKTTLVRVLATLTRPDSGDVRIAGLDPARQGPVTRRLTGVVTHEPMLYDELTGYENLRFAGRMFGLDSLDDRIEAVAGQLSVTSRLDQRVGVLSHGLRKRFTIARALLHDPLVLLMDEPETGLDPEALAMLDAIVRDGSRPFRTVLMTTHSVERGLRLGDSLAILARGEIVYQQADASTATPESVRAAYFRHTGATS